MGAMLNGPEQRPLVWAEHREILRLVLSITGRGGGLFTAKRDNNATAIEIASSLVQPRGKLTNEGERQRETKA